MLFAMSQALPFDTEGRIVLPEDLAGYAHITDSAAFVGLGKSFQIWEPNRFADHQASLREQRAPPRDAVAAAGRLCRAAPRMTEGPDSVRSGHAGTPGPSRPRDRGAGARVTEPFMSTGPLAAAVTAKRCWLPRIAVSSALIAIRRRCTAGVIWQRSTKGVCRSSKAGSATWYSCSRRLTPTRSPGSPSTSAFPRPSSIPRNAGFRFAQTGRSTCE